MSKSFRKDLTGQRFGRLTVLEFVPDDSVVSRWRCICDCGNSTINQASHLKSGKTTSCGCKKTEHIKEMNSKYIKNHNLSYHRIFRIWANIRQRCYNKKNKSYKNYGGRGITVCDEWKNDVKAFYDWAMANGYSDDLSIDRIDNDKGYFPENCRWADRKTQNCNRRNNVIVEYNDKRLCLEDAARLSGINSRTILQRYRKGKRGSELFRPVKKGKVLDKY